MLRWLPASLWLAACQWSPGYPVAEPCPEFAGPTYDASGAPTRCYLLAAMQQIEPRVRECGAPADGMLRIAFEFDAQGTARSVHAEFECHTCSDPHALHATKYLSCVEQAARAAQVVPGPSQRSFRVTYPFWANLDPRLKLGWAPMEP
ncbi:MAG TPA: hypothetical protein VJR89_18300 [Polyangiales bacterium]|nr:hypothetical protein [Polyangiales bacterium]